MSSTFLALPEFSLVQSKVLTQLLFMDQKKGSRFFSPKKMICDILSTKADFNPLWINWNLVFLADKISNTSSGSSNLSVNTGSEPHCFRYLMALYHDEEGIPHFHRPPVVRLLVRSEEKDICSGSFRKEVSVRVELLFHLLSTFCRLLIFFIMLLYRFFSLLNLFLPTNQILTFLSHCDWNWSELQIAQISLWQLCGCSSMGSDLLSSHFVFDQSVLLKLNFNASVLLFSLFALNARVLWELIECCRSRK